MFITYKISSIIHYNEISFMKKVLILLPIFIFIIGLVFGISTEPSTIFTTSNPNTIEITFLSIFIHNLKAIFVNISGLVTFGITTSINIFLTAFLLGLNIRRAIDANYSIIFILQHTLPHFTEYFAIFISGYLGFTGIELLFFRSVSKSYYIKKIILVFITIPLLLFAAFMEAKFAY